MLARPEAALLALASLILPTSDVWDLQMVARFGVAYRRFLAAACSDRQEPELIVQGFLFVQSVPRMISSVNPRGTLRPVLAARSPLFWMNACHRLAVGYRRLAFSQKDSNDHIGHFITCFIEALAEFCHPVAPLLHHLQHSAFSPVTACSLNLVPSPPSSGCPSRLTCPVWHLLRTSPSSVGLDFRDH